MNTLESYTIENPFGKTDECAKINIYDPAEWFVLSDITNAGMVYTFSAWIKSDADGALTVGESHFLTSPEWLRCKATFTADAIDLPLIFADPGTYYIYHPQLEIGTVATDWEASPEDMATAGDLEAINESVQTIYESAAELAISSDALKASVESTKITVDSLTGEVEATKSEMASMKLAADELKLGFQEIENNGVTKVTTETGFTFDREGMTVDSTESPTKTQVTPDGMTVYKKDADGGQEEVLEATSDGVDATNLHAKTYLIIGGRSRFENYGANRTGCFWIGG